MWQASVAQHIIAGARGNARKDATLGQRAPGCWRKTPSAACVDGAAAAASRTDNLFQHKFVRVKGLLPPLDGVRRSSIPRPFVFGGGRGGDLKDGDLDILRLSSSCWALPFGEDKIFDSFKLIQLFSRCISIPPLRNDDVSSLSSCMGRSFFFGEADRVRFSFVSLEST